MNSISIFLIIIFLHGGAIAQPPLRLARSLTPEQLVYALEKTPTNSTVRFPAYFRFRPWDPAITDWRYGDITATSDLDLYVYIGTQATPAATTNSTKSRTGVMSAPMRIPITTTTETKPDLSVWRKIKPMEAKP